MATIPTLTKFPKPNQIPSEAILDINGKQAYLGNAFILVAPGISLSTTNETNLVYINNPITSGKTIFVTLRRVSSSLQPVFVKFYINPTVTSNGSVITPVNLRMANSNTSISNCYTGPSTSSNGTLIQTLPCPQSYYVVSDSTLFCILDPGQSKLVTGTAQTATTSIDLDISWYEL